MPAIEPWQACVLGVCLMGTLLCCIGMFVVVYRNPMLAEIASNSAEPVAPGSGRRLFGPPLQHRIAYGSCRGLIQRWINSAILVPPDRYARRTRYSLPRIAGRLQA